MNAPPDMLEFSRLVQRWLDQTATDADAARLWEMVGAHPECARELAAEARMEGLLEQCYNTQSREADAAGWLFTLTKAKPAAKQYERWQRHAQTAARIAAVLMLVCGIWWWMARDATEKTAPSADVSAVGNAKKNPPSRPRLPPVARVIPRQPVAGPETDATLTPGQLSEWLDHYFLAGIDLDDVPLREALTQLQAEMLRLNFFGADIGSRLRLTFSADAAERRVSFKSPSISVLKAVRALAALAGCEVVVGDRLVMLEALPQTFPQPSVAEDLRNVLAGLLDAHGAPAAQTPEQVERVRQDAVSLGFLPADADPSAFMARLTRGEIEALRFLAEARAQLAAMPRKNYQIGVVPEGTYGLDRVLTPEEVETIRADLAGQDADQIVTVQPGDALTTPVTTQAPDLRLFITPLGDGWHATLVPTTVAVTPALQPGIAMPREETLGNQPAIASTSAGLESLPSAVMSLDQGAVLTLGSTGMTNTTGGLQSTSSTNLSLSLGTTLLNSQIVILPANPPPAIP